MRGRQNPALMYSHQHNIYILNSQWCRGVIWPAQLSKWLRLRHCCIDYWGNQKTAGRKHLYIKSAVIIKWCWPGSVRLYQIDDFPPVKPDLWHGLFHLPPAAVVLSPTTGEARDTYTGPGEKTQQNRVKSVFTTSVLILVSWKNYLNNQLQNP